MVDFIEVLLEGLDTSRPIDTGPFAERPSPTTTGAIYKAVDRNPPEYYACDGDDWIELTVRASKLGTTDHPVGQQHVASLAVDGATETLDGAFPGWGSANQVTNASGNGRLVSVSMTIAADTDSPARIKCQAEDAAGAMQTVLQWEVPAGVITTAINVSGSFLVPGGRAYHFTRTENAGVTEQNKHYSFVDIGV